MTSFDWSQVLISSSLLYGFLSIIIAVTPIGWWKQHFHSSSTQITNFNISSCSCFLGFFFSSSSNRHAKKPSSTPQQSLPTHDPNLENTLVFLLFKVQTFSWLWWTLCSFQAVDERSHQQCCRKFKKPIVSLKVMIKKMYGIFLTLVGGDHSACDGLWPSASTGLRDFIHQTRKVMWCIHVHAFLIFIEQAFF